jgi:hypothetical protein
LKPQASVIVTVKRSRNGQLGESKKTNPTVARMAARSTPTQMAESQGLAAFQAVNLRLRPSIIR